MPTNEINWLDLNDEAQTALYQMPRAESILDELNAASGDARAYNSVLYHATVDLGVALKRLTHMMEVTDVD